MIKQPASPSREQIAILEPFCGLDLKDISVVSGPHEAQRALEKLSQYHLIGFDTESRPTFRKDEVSQGPHILQFSTLENAWIFQANCKDSIPAIIELLQSPGILKIGFGLKDDLKFITRKFGVEPQGIIDLNHSFKQLGHKNTIGAKTAIAMLFSQKLSKSKKTTTSDWSRPNLTEKQILYAANDSYAALRVYLALQNSAHATP